MPLPVSEPGFWKGRLERAKKEGMLHYSVYLANPTLWNKILKAHKAVFEKEISSTDYVLDAGCGYGRLSPLFEHYLGVDISPDLIQEAEKLNPGKTFMVGDLKKLPFGDKEFDVAVVDSIKGMIVGNLGLPEWQQMENELKRVCKRVLILEYGDTVTGSPENYEVL